MNHINSKYFHFFLPEKNSKLFIKFKSINSKFYSANSIFKPTILSKLIYSVDFENIKYDNLISPGINFPIYLKNIKKLYYTYENISLIVENKLNNQCKFNFVVLDSNLNIKFIYDDILNENEEKKIDFYLNSEDEYKIMFYCNNTFIFFYKIKVLKKTILDKVQYHIQNEKLIYFKIEGYKDILTYSIYNKFTGETGNQLVAENRKFKKQELYVPFNNIIENIEDDNFLRYLKVNKHTKYNAKGMYKIVQSIRYMNTKEQINFIESLFNTDEKLAYMILNNVFNFHLLYIVPDIEKREILKFIDIDALAYAVKSEPVDKQKFLKNFINKKDNSVLEKKLKEIKIVSEEEINEAQQAIGDIIRAYYQLKYGVPFIIDNFQDKRLKEQIFNNKLVFTDKYKFVVPEFYFSGHYAVYLKSEQQTNFELALNSKTGRDTLNFTDYYIFETKNFFSVYNVDTRYIYLKFFKPVLKAQIIISSNKNNFEITEFNHILQDEIVPIEYYNQKSLSVFIGVLYENNKYDECEFFIEIDDKQKINKEQFHIEESEISIDIKNWLITYKKSFKDKLNALYKIRDNNLLYLILEFKIYNFLFTELEDIFYKNLSEIVRSVIVYKYFKNGLFKINTENEYNLNDTIEVLFYLRDIYKSDIFDKEIDESLNIIKKRKIKDNRLAVYNKKFSKNLKELKKAVKTNNDVYYKYISKFL